MAKRSNPQPTYEPELRDDWLDRIARFNQHFGRFVRDSLGVLLIAAALMSFLALRGYTKGILLTPWASLLSLWFGWGSYLIVIAITYAGLSLLLRDKAPLGWGRVFALELAAFLTSHCLPRWEATPYCARRQARTVAALDGDLSHCFGDWAGNGELFSYLPPGFWH